MQKPYRVYVDDILESIRKIEEYTKGMVFKEFLKNEMVVDAVIRNMEIIGEAVKHIPTDVKKKHPEIEWKKIAGLRDILIHEYSGVNNEIIWDVVTDKIPKLKDSLKAI